MPKIGKVATDCFIGLKMCLSFARVSVQLFADCRIFGMCIGEKTVVTIKFKKRWFYWKNHWFADKPRFVDLFKYTIFTQCKYQGNVFGFKKLDFYTKVIDIDQSEEKILTSFRKNTRYEISRAKNEEIQARLEKDLDIFIDFYNRFSKTKNMQKINKDYLGSFKDSLVITEAVHDNEILVMHAYIVDPVLRRVRLLRSASLFRINMENDKSQLIGRANRFLHFRDIILFKNMGMTHYDMGGYRPQTDDAELKNIMEFKDSFGGQLIYEPHFIPYPLFFASRIKSILLSKKTLFNAG